MSRITETISSPNQSSRYGYIPAENILVAAAIGVVSGWAATGFNQTIRQETED